MKKHIYMVEHRTWSRSEIVDCYNSESLAKKIADKLEANKKRNDGYMEYYVKKMELK